MKNLKLVQPDGVVPAPAPGLSMPRHFKAKQKSSWNDLIESTDAALHVKENRFTFEIAATLMAKFRSGDPMNATETKELKKHLVALGLAKDEDDGKKKPRKNAKYFDGE